MRPRHFKSMEHDRGHHSEIGIGNDVNKDAYGEPKIQSHFVRFNLHYPNSGVSACFLSSDSFLIQSWSVATEYFVSLKEQTCTCPDFEWRRHQPINHFSRWCKHLLTTFLQIGAFDQANDWQKAIANLGYGGPIEAFVVKTEKQQEFLVTASLSDEWLDVYGRKVIDGEKSHEASGELRVYGWSIYDQRWSYGESPPGARELRRLLLKIEGMERF